MQHSIVRATTEEKRVPLSRAAVAAAAAAAAAASSAISSSSSSLPSALAAAAPPSRIVHITYYDIDCARIYYRTRYPKYTLLMKERFGDEAEVRFRTSRSHSSFFLLFLFHLIFCLFSLYAM